MKRIAYFLALLPLLAGPAGQPALADPSIGAGTTVTAGSSGYGEISVYADGLWHKTDLDPYAWVELSQDNYISQLALAGGVWKHVRRNLRVKGGMGIATGELKEFHMAGSAFLLETAIEKDLNISTLGAAYRLTAGTLVGPGVLQETEQVFYRHAQSRGAQGTAARPQSLTYNEFSVYGMMPAGQTLLKLTLALGLPSYAGAIPSETLSWRIPVTDACALTPSIALEQEYGADNVYFSLGFYYLFY